MLRTAQNSLILGCGRHPVETTNILANAAKNSEIPQAREKTKSLFVWSETQKEMQCQYQQEQSPQLHFTMNLLAIQCVEANSQWTRIMKFTPSLVESNILPDYLEITSKI